MHLESTVTSGGALFVLVALLLVGGPMLLMNWIRRRRQASVDRQIELTDALDEQFGPVVAPVVRNPLFGPWEIQIAVPLWLLRSATLAGILPVVDDVFAAAGVGSHAYRVILRARPGSLRVAPVLRPAGWNPGRSAVALSTSAVLSCLDIEGGDGAGVPDRTRPVSLGGESYGTR